MTDWNPNDPAVIGPEFTAVRESETLTGLYAPVVAQRFRSSAVETIAALRLWRSIANPTGATVLAEVYAAGDEAAGAEFTTVTYAPNALAVIAGSVTGGFADIATWPPTFATQVQMGSSASFDLRFASGGFAPTGRIAAVAVEMVNDWGMAPLPAQPDSARRTVVALDNGGTLYGTITRIIPNNDSSGTAGRAVFTWGEVNPITGRPWVQQDLVDLSTGTTEVRVARQSGDGGTWRASAVRLVVVYETTERRLAVGAIDTSASAAAGWSSNVTLTGPTGSANWAKADATDYALVVRQADEGNLIPFAGPPLGWGTVHAAAGHEPPADLPSYDLTMTATTFLTDGAAVLSGPVATAAALCSGRVLPFVLRTGGGVTSADGQPYTQVRTPGVSSGSGNTQQEIRSSTGDTYAGLRLTAGWFPAVPTAALTVAVRRRSDDVVMGTITVPADLVAGAGIGELIAVEVKAPAPGITLAGGVQYYLDFTSAAPSTAGWVVGLLAVQAGGGGVLYQEATYGGGTDQADPIAGAAAAALTYTPADFVAVLEAGVDTPSGFTVTADEDPLPDAQPTRCALTGIPYASLTWDPTALGADFAAYQIERLNPDGVTWDLIGSVAVETDDGFDDVEARLGVAESYRLRVVRTDGASSYYTDVETVTVPAAGCGYTFTSNQAPTMGVAYPDVYAGRSIRSYEFPEAAEVQYRTLYGRDFQVAFHPLSRRGVTFTRRLLIGGFAAPAAGIGPPAAALIRDLAWEPLDYVAVRDQDGNRWYSSVRVPTEDAWRNGSSHLLWVDVAVVEVTATPSVSTIGTNSPGGPLSFVDGTPMSFVDGDPVHLVT